MYRLEAWIWPFSGIVSLTTRPLILSARWFEISHNSKMYQQKRLTTGFPRLNESTQLTLSFPAERGADVVDGSKNFENIQAGWITPVKPTVKLQLSSINRTSINWGWYILQIQFYRTSARWTRKYGIIIWWNSGDVLLKRRSKRSLNGCATRLTAKNLKPWWAYPVTGALSWVINVCGTKLPPEPGKIYKLG